MNTSDRIAPPTPPPESDVRAHFTARALRYDSSSSWCTDREFLQEVISLIDPAKDAKVLDVACGTGLVARALRPRVGRIVGLDLTPAMYEQARDAVDELLPGAAEDMPFPDASFDLVICRQGIQFMNDARAAAEMVRVTRPGGKICLINLCAFGDLDRERYFEILALRNPARRNFYLCKDLEALLRKAGCSEAVVHERISREDVDAWADNGAIEDANRKRIRELYETAPPEFRRLHAIQCDEAGKYFDDMLFGIAIGVR